LWLLAAAPIRPSRLLLAKWIVSLCVGAVGVTLAVGVVSVLQFHAAGALLGLGAGAVVAALVATYAVGVSATFPRFDWDSPRYATTTAGGCVLSATLIGLMLLGGFSVVAALLLRERLGLGGAMALSALSALAVAAVPAGGLLWAGYKHLARLEWEL
jgi:hypothetical protein